MSWGLVIQIGLLMLLATFCSIALIQEVKKK